MQTATIAPSTTGSSLSSTRLDPACRTSGVIAEAICRAVPALGSDQNHWSFRRKRATRMGRSTESIPGVIRTRGEFDVIDGPSGLDHAISKLRPTARMILHLRFVEGLTSSEIGRKLGRTEATVQRAAGRALMDLWCRQNRED